MMAKLAKCLNESDINVILTQSASMSNLTAALKNLRVKVSCFSSNISRWMIVFSFRPRKRVLYLWISIHRHERCSSVKFIEHLTKLYENDTCGYWQEMILICGISPVIIVRKMKSSKQHAVILLLIVRWKFNRILSIQIWYVQAMEREGWRKRVFLDCWTTAETIAFE